MNYISGRKEEKIFRVECWRRIEGEIILHEFFAQRMKKTKKKENIFGEKKIKKKFCWKSMNEYEEKNFGRILWADRPRRKIL